MLMLMSIYLFTKVFVIIFMEEGGGHQLNQLVTFEYVIIRVSREGVNWNMHNVTLFAVIFTVSFLRHINEKTKKWWMSLLFGGGGGSIS